MSIFSGKRGLRHQFEKLVPADLSGATTRATAKLWIEFRNWSRLSYLDNSLVDISSNPVDVNLVLVHPDADVNSSEFRLDWLELPGLRVINYSTGDAAGVAFDPGTRLMVYTTGIPTSGALRISSWG